MDEDEFAKKLQAAVEANATQSNVLRYLGASQDVVDAHIRADTEMKDRANRKEKRREFLEIFKSFAIQFGAGLGLGTLLTYWVYLIFGINSSETNFWFFITGAIFTPTFYFLIKGLKKAINTHSS